MNRETSIPLFKWDSKEVSYQIVSGRTIRLQSTAAYIDTRTDDRGRTCSVVFEDRYSIKLEETLKLMDEEFPVQFRIREIQRVSDVNNMILLHSHRRTLSSYFLLPLLGKDRNYFSFNGYFVNAYLHKSNSKREKLKFLYLLYTFSSSLEFAELEARLRKHPMYISCCNPDRAHLMYTFRIPGEHHSDISIFLLGSYSRLTEDAKKGIAKFHGFNRTGTMWKILYKDAKLKAELEKKLEASIPDYIELFDRPSWQNEIYTEKMKDL